MTNYQVRFFLGLLILLPACQTMRGMVTQAENFPNIEDKSCIERGIRAVPEAQFGAYEKTEASARSLGNDDIKEWSHNFSYTIPGLNDPNGTASVLIRERSSNNKKYNLTVYSNGFGYLNGKSYSAEEKAHGELILNKVNLSIKKECALPNLKF